MPPNPGIGSARDSCRAVQAPIPCANCSIIAGNSQHARSAAICHSPVTGRSHSVGRRGMNTVTVDSSRPEFEIAAPPCRRRPRIAMERYPAAR